MHDWSLIRKGHRRALYQKFRKSPNDFFRALGAGGPAGKIGEQVEIGRSSDLIGVVMVSAGDEMKGFWRPGCLEDLSPHVGRNDIVLVAVED